MSGKEANGDNLKSLSDLLCNNGMLSVLIRIALMKQILTITHTHNFMIF